MLFDGMIGVIFGLGVVYRGGSTASMAFGDAVVPEIFRGDLIKMMLKRGRMI
jgi:hypothetical protein